MQHPNHSQPHSYTLVVTMVTLLSWGLRECVSLNCWLAGRWLTPPMKLVERTAPPQEHPQLGTHCSPSQQWSEPSATQWRTEVRCFSLLSISYALGTLRNSLCEAAEMAPHGGSSTMGSNTLFCSPWKPVMHWLYTHACRHNTIPIKLKRKFFIVHTSGILPTVPLG